MGMVSGGLKRALTENPLRVFLTHDNKSFKTATNHDEAHLRHKLGPLFRHDEYKAYNLSTNACGRFADKI